MKLLALDTATEACSVALAHDDRIHSRHVEAPREHGDRLLGMIDELLVEAGLARGDLELLAFGRGPGAFTGVRIATGVAQGIGYALNLPLAPISTLATLAQGAARTHGAERVIAAIDARMGEIYFGNFALDENGVMQPTSPERVCVPAAFEPPPGAGWTGCGTGWETYGDILSARCGEVLASSLGRRLPDAVDMVALARDAVRRGALVKPAEATPIYLRDRVAARPPEN